MSKIALEGNASGTGTLTIAAPNTSTDRTLDIPDASGTIDRLNRAGNVLQVVNATYATNTVVTSTSYTDSNLSASITPSSASSKILIIVALSGRVYTQSTSDRVYFINLVRNSTQVTQKSSRLQGGLGGSSFLVYPIPDSLNYLDSPATTSSVTYKVQMRVDDSSSTTALSINQDSGVSTITLMEIAA